MSVILQQLGSHILFKVTVSSISKDNYQYLSNNYETPGLAINQMLEKANHYKYLYEGLKMLQAERIEIDRLLTTHINSPLTLLNSSEVVEMNPDTWRCDNCGKDIANPKQGMLQWLTGKEDDRHVGHDLRIVHHNSASPLDRPSRCYPDEQVLDGLTVGDEHLESMLGPEGLVKLLAMVKDGLFSADQVSVIIMRLNVPHYEQARPYFQWAIAEGIVSPNLPDGYFLQSDLREIVANIPQSDD